jgi:hypothetical protein
MRRWLPILVLFGLAAMAAVALAQVGGAPAARAATVATTGAFEISNSHEGGPIFAAGGLAPGGSARGTVAIEDTGSDPVALTLRRGALVDTPGVGSGVLSERLQLTVVDVTDPASPRSVYSGPLASMPDQPAGSLEAGETRTFEFTATLPGGGAASFQNAVQGASTTVAYSWIASEASEGGGGSGGGEEHATPAPPAPPVPVPPVPVPPDGGGEAIRAGEVLNLTVPKVRAALRRGRLVVWTNCNQSCRLTVRGRLRAKAGSNHRGARVNFTKKHLYSPGPQRLRIPVPRKLRRWMRETPARERLRAKLRFLAVGTGGDRDVVRRAVQLRVPRRR